MYIKIVFNEGIVLSIVATGAIFIYTLGSFDISLGAATLFAATLGVLTYNATENFSVDDYRDFISQELFAHWSIQCLRPYFIFRCLLQR